MAGEDLEQEGEYGGNLGDDRIIIRFDGMVPSLGKVLQEHMVLLVPTFSLLRIEVFAEDGSLAGQIEVVSRVEEGIEESFEQVQAYGCKLPVMSTAIVVPTTSEVALGALVEEERILQVARRGDFLGSAVWTRRVALVVVVKLLALGVAVRRCAFRIGFESRPLPHYSCIVAIQLRMHLESFGQFSNFCGSCRDRSKARTERGKRTTNPQTSVITPPSHFLLSSGFLSICTQLPDNPLYFAYF